MSETLSKEAVNAFYSLNSQGRYDHLVEQVKASGVLWTLADDQGCIIIDTGSEQCLLLWHHEDLAKTWITGDYDNCQPMAIKREDFIEKWAPGMTKDGFEVGVAVSLAGEGIVVSAEELAAELAA